MVAGINRDELKCYVKVENVVYNTLWSFFSHHTELMFMKFEMPLLKSILTLIIRGLSDSTFETQSDCTNCINIFCEFVHEKLERNPTQKSVYLVQCVKNFYSESFATF
jgi:hypothetical protein